MSVTPPAGVSEALRLRGAGLLSRGLCVAYLPSPRSCDASVGRRRSGTECERSGITGTREVGIVSSATQCIGSPANLPAPLPRDKLQYGWLRYSRTGITLGELLTRSHLSPDLLRIRKIHDMGLSEAVSTPLGRLVPGGSGIVYQIPEEIPGDCTFTESVGEALYVDKMAAFKYGRSTVDAGRLSLTSSPAYMCYRVHTAIRSVELPFRNRRAR